MARSLDGLIRHLVDQIALCGERGESTRFSLSSSVRVTHALRLPIFSERSSAHCTIMLPENPDFFFGTLGYCKILPSDSGGFCRQACGG